MQTRLYTYQSRGNFYLSSTKSVSNVCSSLELANHLGNVLSVISDKVIPYPSGSTVAYYKADILQSQDYSPFGVTLKNRGGKKTGLSDKFRFGYQGSEQVDEVKGEGNSYSTFFRQLDPRLGRWLSLDPAFQPWQSPYCSMDNNPIILNDPKGNIPLPVISTWKGKGWKISSGFGKRNVKNNRKASRFHEGVDINSVLGGDSDIGAQVVATHQGTVLIDNNTEGGTGRNVTITSPNGDFRTNYYHLATIDVQDGLVLEGQQIGTLGRSQFGKENFKGMNGAHLHYEIQIKKDGEWVNIDPQFDSDLDGDSNNNISNLVDPQLWVDEILEVGTLNEVKTVELEEVVITANRPEKPCEKDSIQGVEKK